MKVKKDCLYIFFHIPKTAGTTFRYHVEKNLNKDEYLFINQETLGLDKNKTSVEYKEFAKLTKKLIKQLSDYEKSKLKIIVSHYVPNGIEKFFNKDVRYITFIRDPIKRTISLYTSIYGAYLKNKTNNTARKYYKRVLLLNDKVPDFEKWLKDVYCANSDVLSQTAFLEKMNYLDKKYGFQKMFKIFFFIGLTEEYSSDSLFLYELIGINKYFINQNVTEKYFDLNINRRTEQKISRANYKDLNLYKHALKARGEFVKHNSVYKKKLGLLKLKRNLLISFTQIIFAFNDTKRLYSFRLRKRFKFYSKILDWSKLIINRLESKY